MNSNSNNKEPLWRQVLCWAAVISFFAIPTGFYFMQVICMLVPAWQITDAELKHFQWLGNYLRTLATLVFGLAGLNSFDSWKGGGKKES
jgi:hypothetical protein